ncbi:MAG TPA: glycosyltransferase, partial [Gammaproteobacteria bacterium]|nr:glycosyltransferase [Gammaproteobacteria bacterium]
VGRLNRLKGFDRVRAFAEHLDRHFRGAVRIHVVGKDTPDTPGLLEGMALDSVELIRHGYLDDDQLNALYRRCAYCLFPSRNEGFGLPLLEAIWQRCVPVLSEIAIFREVTGSGFPLFTADGDGIVRMTAFVERMRADPAYRREITDAMEGVLARWGDGYTRAARNLLAWSRPGRPHAMEVTRE